MPIVRPSESPATAHPGNIRLQQPALVNIGTGYDRTLPAASRWRFAGTVPQGAVYQAVGSVFTLEGAHVHEAYLVIRGEDLVGFYLPVEQAFSPLKASIPLLFKPD